MSNINNIERLAKDLVNLSIMDLIELSKILKNKYGINFTNDIQNKDKDITKNIPKKFYNLILKSSGTSKLSVIKLVKEIIGVSLTEAKKYVDNLPIKLMENISKEEY